jgi:hypothetical protein
MRATKPVTRPSVLSQNKVELIATNLAEYKTVAPPPKGFNPFRATMDELHKYHLPHCPDPRTSKAAAKAWRKVMSRIRTYVAPQLKPGNRVRPASLGNPAKAKHGTQSGWAGIVASEGSFTQVWCIFVYPNVVAPSGSIAKPVGDGNPNYTFNAWIGLDGTDGSGDVCQAGVETDLYVQPAQGGIVTNASTYPWIEWYPLGTIVENFLVSPGDTIGLLIQYLGVSDNQFQASVQFSNLTTGIAITPIILSAPYGTLKKDDALYEGNTAEWIVEPTAYANGVYSAIADFGDLIFVDAGALSQPGGSKGTIVDASKENQETNIVVDHNIVASEISTPALQISYLPTAGPQHEPGIEQTV